MRELLKRLAELEPERFQFAEDDRLGWFCLRIKSPNPADSRVAYDSLLYDTGWPGVEAWVLTGVLLESALPRIEIKGVCGGEWFWGLDNDHGLYATYGYAPTPHEATLRAYLAYRESAATSGGGE